MAKRESQQEQENQQEEGWQQEESNTTTWWLFFKPIDQQCLCQFIKGVRPPEGLWSKFNKRVNDSSSNLVV